MKWGDREGWGMGRSNLRWGRKERMGCWRLVRGRNRDEWGGVKEGSGGVG